MTLRRITSMNIFGQSEIRQGEILEERQHGWDLPSGAWSLYEAKGATPATFVKIRWKWKRKAVWVNKRKVLGVG
ncbi:MAG: hypothetical protein M0R74_17225 [Dehalococcoidia bacterium]|nr:hypothetical protein [Dehalococcoidia bacterium]